MQLAARIRLPQSFAFRKPPHRIVIAQGEKVRSFTVRPGLIIAIGAVFAVFSALYLSATGYLVFRDDLLAASLARQSRMQHAYEDRIATLRADIDRLTSRQLLDQDSLEAEMDRLKGRQTALDARQDSLAGLSQAARLAGLDPAALLSTAPVPSPIDDQTDNQAADSAASDAPAADAPAPEPAKVPPLKTSSLAPVGLGPLAFGPSADPPASGNAVKATESQLKAVDTSIDELAASQVGYVDAIAAAVSARSKKIAAVLAHLGQKVPPSHLTSSEVGGPYVAVDANADPDTFRATVDLVNGEIDRYAAMRRLAERLPLTRPIADAPVTSGFGTRIDPFLGTLAMHTGIDFRALEGTPAHATAGGTVTVAAYTGGYGNMVEIDNGNGITTRYGHLSRIDVTVGQVVAKGAVIGHTGSTGRSTGPHLHYEIRIDGSPIDPLIWIRSGTELASLL